MSRQRKPRRARVVSNGLDSLIGMIDEPHRTACRRVMQGVGSAFRMAPGSRQKHQAWLGGYRDHVTEVMNTIHLNWDLDKQIGRIPLLPAALQYSLSDALLIGFLHDCEKPFIYNAEMWPNSMPPMGPGATKAERAHIRLLLITHWKFKLDGGQIIALAQAEGIRDSDFSSTTQLMTPLGYAVHAADLKSAVFSQFPLAQDDPFTGARRCNRDEPTTQHRPE